MVLLNFFNFIALLFGIFYPGSCRKDRNDNFFFLSFSTCPNLFWLEMKPELCILIFCIFLLFFLEFSILGQVGRIGTIIFFFSHSRPLLTRFGFKWSLNGWFLIFWIFLLFFSEFSILGRVGRIRTIYFFSLIRDLSRPILAWNEAWMVLFNFLNFFFSFFQNFLFWVG